MSSFSTASGDFSWGVWFRFKSFIHLTLPFLDNLVIGFGAVVAGKLSHVDEDPREPHPLIPFPRSEHI